LKIAEAAVVEILLKLDDYKQTKQSFRFSVVQLREQRIRNKVGKNQWESFFSKLLQKSNTV